MSTRMVCIQQDHANRLILKRYVGGKFDSLAHMAIDDAVTRKDAEDMVEQFRTMVKE